ASRSWKAPASGHCQRSRATRSRDSSRRPDPCPRSGIRAARSPTDRTGWCPRATRWPHRPGGRRSRPEAPRPTRRSRPMRCWPSLSPTTAVSAAISSASTTRRPPAACISSTARAAPAPAARRGMKALPVIGPATVSVPGVTHAWAMLLERFGSRPLDRLLAPAIHYAERGFPITSLLSQGITEYAPGNPDPEWRRVFFAGDRAPAPGTLFVQPDLARTLRDLATQGPDLFYRGRVAQGIAERMATEGFLTPDDLAAHRGEWGEPVSTTYRGFTVYETPPPTQGITALMTLNMLEGFPLAKWP